MATARSGFSEFLHQRRIAVGKRWKQVLSNAYLSRATLHRIRHGDPLHPIAEADSLRALANALQFSSWVDLVDAWQKQDPRAHLEESPALNPEENSNGNGVAHDDPVLTLSKALNLTPTELVRRIGVGSGISRPDAALPTSLQMDQIRPARFVPHFVSGVAASRRVEKLEDEDADSRQPVTTQDARVFTIPVDGDCQEPVWNHGEIVLFSFDAFDREGIVPGKSYYLAFTDGSTTFKRVFLNEADPHTYILRCWNTKKYPQEKIVPAEDVVRIARALAKQINPEESD